VGHQESEKKKNSLLPLLPTYTNWRITLTYYNTPSACNDGYADDVNQILPGLSRQKEDKKKAFPISERIG